MNIDLNNGNLLTVGQVARILHLHPNTVRRWNNNGILTAYRISKRGDRRFRKEDVALLFKSRLFDCRIKGYNPSDKLTIDA